MSGSMDSMPIVVLVFSLVSGTVVSVTVVTVTVSSVVAVVASGILGRRVGGSVGLV